MKIRNIVITISILVLIGLGVFIFFREADEEVPPDDNNNDVTMVPEEWVEFRDEIIGFSMRHPPEWNTHEAVSYDDESSIESFDRDELPTGQVPPEEIKVGVRRFLEDTDIEYSPPEEEQIIEERDIVVANRNATWFEVETLGTNISVVLTDDQDTYVISAYPADSQYLEEFELMLGTFEFIPSIEMENPLPRQQVTSPIEVRGMAPGTWFFEASMTARLETAEEDLETEAIITTTAEEWMTTEQIPFEGTIPYSRTPALNDTISATLIIRAANPSGLPEHEKFLRIPLTLE